MVRTPDSHSGNRGSIPLRATRKGVKKMAEQLIGRVTHYFTNIGVAVIEVVKGGLEVGDKIHIKGSTSDFEQAIDSMQVEHQEVKKAKKGDMFGLKVAQHAREGDEVYKAA